MKATFNHCVCPVITVKQHTRQHSIQDRTDAADTVDTGNAWEGVSNLYNSREKRRLLNQIFARAN